MLNALFQYSSHWIHLEYKADSKWGNWVWTMHILHILTFEG